MNKEKGGTKISVVVILLSGVILCFMGFYNNYPLVFPDSGTYIHSGFTKEVPIDRPITYGLFIRHISLADSLWLVIWVQGVLLSLVVFYYFKYFSPGSKAVLYFLLYIFIITFFTGASVNVSQLIPDIFTSIAILSFGLIILVDKLKRRDLVIVSSLLLLSIAMHNSHFLLFFLLIILMLACMTFKRFRTTFFKYNITLKKILLTLVLVILGNVTISTIHFFYGSGFSSSRGGHVFLMTRLINTGLLKDYLNKNCKALNYKLCDYKDHSLWNFMWDYENSPLYKTGGWLANKQEYDAIIKDILTTPYYLKIFTIRAIESAFKQFFDFDTGDTPVQRENSPPYGAIDWHFKTQVDEYLNSKQNKGMLNYDFLNNIQTYVIAFSLFFLIAILLAGEPDRLKLLILFLLIALFINAAVCGALSGVFPRYQSRVIWLLPLPLIIYLSNNKKFNSLIGNFAAWKI